VKKGVKKDNPYARGNGTPTESKIASEIMQSMEGFLPPPGTTININSTQNIHISQPTHI
jgi:hypothetical protein